MHFRRFLATAAASAALAAQASTYSDLWYDPQQPGSAVNVVQQLETAFVTVYSYGTDGRPTWLVASDARITAYSEPGGFPLFQGTLYRTEGSFHGAPYDPSRSKVVPVGELSLEVLDRNRMRVHYTAEGAKVVRELQRYTFAQPIELSSYVAQFNLRQARAGQPYGTLYVQADVLAHLDSDTGAGFLRVDDQLGRRCEYRGPYEVTGKLVRFSGAYTCDRGDQPAGTFEMTEIEFTAHGLTGYLRTSAPGGDGQYGRFGGVRR